VPAKVAEIELQSHDEQQQDQPKLAEHAEGFRERRIENRLGHFRKEVAETGRTEHETRGDLAHDRRLPEFAKDRGKDPRRHDDDDQLDQRLEEQFLAIDSSRGCGEK